MLKHVVDTVATQVALWALPPAVDTVTDPRLAVMVRAPAAKEPNDADDGTVIASPGAAACAGAAGIRAQMRTAASPTPVPPANWLRT
ncbi:MAG: hypothetical protein H7233_09780 [Pseudorhodobacter sp.]|nr:hypothetical protein [Frankiaceae bacterium]